MNGREAIQAMLDGKVVYDPRGARWRLDNSGFQAWDDRYNQWVPCNFLGNRSYDLYVGPNPHPEGTYFWAKEEHARGRSVISPAGDRVRAGYDWSKIALFSGEFEVDTWKIDQ